MSSPYARQQVNGQFQLNTISGSLKDLVPKVGFRFITFTRANCLYVRKKHNHVSVCRLCSGKFIALCIIPVIKHYC